MLRTPRYKRIEQEITDKARTLIERMGLGDVLDEDATDLPYGDQRKLEIARAL